LARDKAYAVLIDMLDSDTRRSFLRGEMEEDFYLNACGENLIPCLFRVLIDKDKGAIVGKEDESWNLYRLERKEGFFHSSDPEHRQKGVLFLGYEKIDVEGSGSDEPVEMSDWELQECAIQVVMDYGIRKEGKYKISSYSNAPEVDPQIWMVDKYGNRKWVMVRNAMYPERRAKMPDNMGSWARSLDSGGFFASVAFCAACLSGPPCRHEGVIPYFTGLEEVK